MASVVAATDTSLIRRKHQHNSAFVQSKTAPKRKVSAYAPVWTRPGAVPLGARRASVEDTIEARFPDSQQVRSRNSVLDSSIDRVSDILGKGPLPASWCTNLGPQRAPAAPVADMLGPGRKGNASASSAVGMNINASGNDQAATGNATARVLSAKAQGKQREVVRQPEPESASAPQLEPGTQGYPQLTSDVIQHATPSSQADRQWVLQEAEKIFARQAQDDPDWTDDDGSGIEEDDDLVFVGQKRRSPTPELPSAAPMKRVRSNDRRESYRSRNRRYETLKSPKSIQQRDQLLAAITRNWNGNIRLAIPEDIGPRHKLGTTKDNVPAKAQDWATCSLEAVKVLSEISKGDPASAQRALRRVVMTPGRKRTWLLNPQDCIDAAKLLNEDAVQGPQSPSVALSEDIRSRLFVTPTPDTTDMDVDDVEVIGRAEDELSGEANVVTDDLGENKPIRDLLAAHGEASAREAVAKQRKQSLIEGAFNAEHGPEILKAWEEEDAARIQKERLEKEIEMLFAASQA